MEPTEQIAYVIVLGLAFLMIAWGLLKLRGTGLLQRRKTEDYHFISREHNSPELDFPDTEGCGFHRTETKPFIITKKDIEKDFQKEDDLE